MSGFTREGPADDEVRIIGVELAVREPNGVEHELEMFECRHTMPTAPWYRPQIRITLHTSRGDVTLRTEV